MIRVYIIVTGTAFFLDRFLNSILVLQDNVFDTDTAAIPQMNIACANHTGFSGKGKL